MAGVESHALILQVDNDGCFWAWILSEGEQFPAQLEQIENEITKHFGSASRQHCVSTVAREQNYLVEKRPGQWARAVVKKKFQSSKAFAEVLFIDHGTVATLPTTLTRFLPMPSVLEDYPPLARQFRMSGIVPTKEKTGSSLWGQTVLKHIQRLSNRSKVSLKVSGTDSEVPKAILYSIDGYVNINSCLVEAGVAQWTKEEGPGGWGEEGTAVLGAGTEAGRGVSEQQSLLDDRGLRGKKPVVSKAIEYDPVVMVSSPRPLPPIHDLKQLGLPVSLTQKLSDEFQPSPIHTHTWPFILEGDNVLAVCPPSEDAKLAYLLPLIAARVKKQQLEGRVPGGRSGAAASGPPVIILCVNSQEVDNVTQTFSFTMSKVLAHERFKLLKKKQMTLGSLDHLVFHGASDLVESFPDEIKLIMRRYVEVVSEMSRLCFLQVVAMTTQCTPDVLSLMEVYAKGGQTVYHTLVTCAIESAVARKPKIEVVIETDFATKFRWMKDYLLAPSRGSVVVTCVSCDQEMQELTRFIHSHSLPALILANEQDLVTYKTHLSTSLHIVLHDNVLPEGLSQLPLTCHIIHYSLPSAVPLFRQRMSLLLKAFRKSLPTEVVMFSDGSTPQQKKYIARLLRRMEHTVPAVLQTEDHQRSPSPPSATTTYDLCYYFCAFGECNKVRAGRSCKLVHSLLPSPDQQHKGPPLYALPLSGTVKFKVCHVGNGSRMWIQILEHHPAKRGDSPFVSPPSYDMTSQLSQYFAHLDQRQRLMQPKPGDYCVLADRDGAYHRYGHLVMLQHGGKVNKESPQLLPGCVKLDKGNQYQVLLAAVNSTTEFYLQTKTSHQHLDELFETLNTDRLPGSAFGKIHIEEGQMVAAIFPEDKCWYRGRVVDYRPSSRQYQVCFVDYGELQWVGETAVQLISEAFLELPCQAVRACLAGLELTPVLAKQAGAQLEEIAEETELTAKVLHVEDSGEDFPYHFVQLFDARGRDLAEILRQQMDESQSMDAQLTTEATPPLPTEALGPLATTLLSPVKSVMDLKCIHANIQKQGASFPLVESELEWAVCRMSQQSTEVMSEVMNIITALVYHRHPSVSVLCEPRPLEAIRGLLKVVSGGECATLVILLRHLLEGNSVNALQCKEWMGALCRVLAVLRDSSALQALLCLMTRMVTEGASLILHLILEGGLSTVMSKLTVLPEAEVQPAALKLLLAVVTAEEGEEVVLSAGPVKAVASTLLQAQDKQTLLLALTIAKELVGQKNRHTSHLLRDPLERLLRSRQPIFVRTVVLFLLSAIDQLPGGGDEEEEAQPTPIPKPIQNITIQNLDCGLDQTPRPPHPNVLWSQTRPMVTLRVQLKDCCSVVVEFGTQTVKLSGLCGGVLHSLDLVLYKEIDSEACSYRVTAGEVVLRAAKKRRELWPRVTLDKTKFPYLQADFDHLSDSSSDEEQESDGSRPAGEGGRERCHPVEVSTSTAVGSTQPPVPLPPDLHPWVESGSSSSSSEEEYDATLPDQWSDHDDNFI